MNNENYGEYLKYQREQAGLSRLQLAQRNGITLDELVGRDIK